MCEPATTPDSAFQLAFFSFGFAKAVSLVHCYHVLAWFFFDCLALKSNYGASNHCLCLSAPCEKQIGK